MSSSHVPYGANDNGAILPASKARSTKTARKLRGIYCVMFEGLSYFVK
jgi:hypothetical protein